MTANTNHLIRLLAVAAQLDEIAGAPRAWTVIESSVDTLGWPTAALPDMPAWTQDAASHQLLAAARRLGASGKSISRGALVDQLVDMRVPFDVVRGLAELLRRGEWSAELDERAATTELREALTRVYSARVASAMATMSRHVAEGRAPLAESMADLARMAASVPGQRVDLPVPEGRAYRDQFARAAKRRLVSTGFAAINEAIAGFAAGDYVGVAARSNIGKTNFLLALARAQLFPAAGRNWQVDASPMEARLDPHRDGAAATDVLLLSLEMSAQSVRERLLFDMLDVNATTWRANPDAAIAESALASKIGIDGYLEAMDAAAATLTIVDGVALGGRSTVAAVDAAISTWAEARRAANPDAALLVLVDYWQRIEAPSGDKSTKQQQLGDASRALALAAKREQVALVCAAQIGRAADNHEPSESELRESGDLLIDADIVMLLHAADQHQRARLDDAQSSGLVIGKTPTDADEAQPKKLRARPKAETKFSKYAHARDCLLVIGGKGRNTAAGWRAPLHFDRAYQRLTDGWSTPEGAWINPLRDADVVAVLDRKKSSGPSSGPFVVD